MKLIDRQKILEWLNFRRDFYLDMPDEIADAFTYDRVDLLEEIIKEIESGAFDPPTSDPAPE